MTKKVISGTYASGYLLSSSYNQVVVATQGSVGGFGLVTPPSTLVENLGHISANNGFNGVYLGAHGKLFNFAGGVIQTTGGPAAATYGKAGTVGGAGVDALAPGYVHNAGVIGGGGGGAGGAHSEIGEEGGAGGAGVQLQGSGALVNTGILTGGHGGMGGAGYNFYTSYPVYGHGGAGGQGGAGATLEAGGRIVDDGGNIYGGAGGSGGTGHYTGSQGTGGSGILLTAGGYAYVETGRVEGGTGAFAIYGGQAGTGVYLASGGMVKVGAGGAVLGGPFSGSAAGAEGIGIELHAGGTVMNAGSIVGEYGVGLAAGGSVINTGTIAGGVRLVLGGTVTNQAEIFGYNGVVARDGIVVNGSASDSLASISTPQPQPGSDYVGVLLGGGSTLITYAYIGGGYAAVTMTSTDTLEVEQGASFHGGIIGGGGTLNLNPGTATISHLAMGGATLALPGSSATVAGFGTINLEAGSTFVLSGPGSVDAGVSLDDLASLAVEGALAVDGTLTIEGTLSGPGTLAIGGGDVDLENAPRLTVAAVSQAGAASTASVLDGDLTYGERWTQTAGTVTVAAGDRFSFTGSGDSFAGTLAGAGEIALARGSDALTGTTISAARLEIGAATVTLSGAIDNGGKIAITSPGFLIAASGAILSGGGVVVFTSESSNAITGASSSATLENVNNRVIGAGQLGNGSLILLNDKAGVIGNNSALGLEINTGTNTILNAGVIEQTGADGALIIDSVVNNTGTLIAAQGALIVENAVTGAGAVRIEGGRASLGPIFDENVSFTSAGGELQLADSEVYGGIISGFSTTGASALDLQDIRFIRGTTKATYIGNSTSGILTVSNGTQTANIRLIGDYSAAGFVFSGDNADRPGTLVRYETQGAGAPSAQRFIADMAAFGAGAAAPAGVTPEAWRAPEMALVSPRSS